MQTIYNLLARSLFILIWILVSSFGIRNEPISVEQGMKMEDSAEKVNVLTTLALLEVERNPSAQKEPFKLVNQAIRTAKKIANSSSLAYAYNTKAIIFREFSTFTQAIQYHKKAIAAVKNTLQESEKIDLLLDLGATYRVSLDFENAKKTFEEALVLSQALELTTMEAVANLNIGFLYTSLEIKENAFQYFEKAEKISEDNSLVNSYILANIGKGISYSLGEKPALSKAKKEFLQAVSSSKKRSKKFFEGVSRIYLGRTYLRMNRISDAYKQFMLSIELLKKYKHKAVFNNDYKSLDDVLKFRNFYSQALSYQNSIKYYRGEISQSQYNSAVKEELELFGNPELDELDQLRTALAELKHHYSFLDSINQLDDEEAVYLLKNYLDQQKSKLNNLETDHSSLQNLLKETEKAAKQKIEVLEQKNKLQEALISKQYWAAASLILLVIFIGVIGGLQYKNNIQKKKVNHELEVRNEKISEQNIEIKSTANQLKNALTSLQLQSKKTKESIHAGWRIQNAMLPIVSDFKHCFQDFFVMYQPRDIVSGDFYWVGQKNEHTIIAALDCTGHGIPGAFMSMMGNALMNQVVNIEGVTSPAEILLKVDQYIAEALSQNKNNDSREGMDVAICSIPNHKKQLKYAGAKNPMLIVHDNGEYTLMKGTNRHVGGNKDKNKQKTYNEHQIGIHSSDTYYIYSDGIQDQFGGPENKKYMRKKLIQDLCALRSLPLKDQQSTMELKFNNWKGEGKQIDDILLIGFKC